ncbi:MAG: CHASE2 domain-containing protein [Leptolyngbyaceae cyanobacterium]
MAAGSILGLRALGGLQLLELRAFDKMMTLRPNETVDQRIVIVGITDADLDNYLGTASLSDRTMARLIDTIQTYQPRVIGLDFYRNLSSGPGSQELETLFASTPNLIGIEKVIGNEKSASIAGNITLKKADQIAASDLVVDPDGHVRRAVLFPAASGTYALESLGLRVALDYLAGESSAIVPQQNTPVLTLNGVTFPPIEDHTGGYAAVDARGYQILLNLRQQSDTFEIVSLRQVLQGQISPDLMRDRIVLIGSMALSHADIFYTAGKQSNGQPTIKFGVELHGEMASQILSAVLDGRSLNYAWPSWIETLLIISTAVGWGLLTHKSVSLWQRLLLVPLASLLILAVGYGALASVGLWLPVVPMILGLWTASAMAGVHRTNQLQVLSAKDKLTGLANRHVFDESLQQAWFKALRAQQPLGLIIGDVDHFKQYNDTYGHPQGDQCLRQVAQAFRTVSQANGGLSARYGGEEFVVLLPNTSAEQGLAIADEILAKLIDYQLPHATSETAQYVTLSLGVTSFIPTLEIPPSALVEMADLGLYTAKNSGRSCVRLHQPNTLDRPSAFSQS